MLGLLRKSVTSWVGMAILAIAVGAMVVTLFQGQTPEGGGGKNAVVAKVGKTLIGENALMQAIENAVQNAREQDESINIASYVRQGGAENALEQLLIGQQVSEYAAAHKMAVSRRMVDGEIASIPAFQSNGSFDETRFRQFLQGQSIREEDIRRDIKNTLLRSQLLRPIVSPMAVPDMLVSQVAKLLVAEHRGAILPVPSQAMKDPGTPDDKALQAFYEKNRARFTVPERRSYRYALLDTAALREKSQPTDEDIRAYYDEHLADYGGLEERSVRQVVLPNEKDAAAFVKKLTDGESFAKIATGYGYTADDIDLGLQNHRSLASATSPEIADKVFALAAGKTTEAIRGDFGYHVLEVSKIVPASPRPFEQVKADIRNELAQENFANLQSELITGAEDRFDAGEAFSDVVASMGAKIVDVRQVSRNGEAYDENFDAKTVDVPLIERVFTTDIADGPHVAEVGEGRYALYELGDVTPPTPAPLDRIRARAIDAWRAVQRLDAAKALADRIAGEAAGDKTLAQASAGNGLPPVQQIAVRRLELTQMAQQGQEIPPPVLMLANLSAEKTSVMPAPEGQGWFVIKTDSVSDGDTSMAEELRPAVRRGLEQEAESEFLDGFMRAVGREVGVVRYPGAVKALASRLSGDDE